MSPVVPVREDGDGFTEPLYLMAFLTVVVKRRRHDDGSIDHIGLQSRKAEDASLAVIDTPAVLFEAESAGRLVFILYFFTVEPIIVLGAVRTC
ncbi:hypothetical protein EYF80_039782 [Liparis tanakae]|uniref:Uncharacterized protein n=1 Tax=Liparis tanakae TaxID=230148 RepID=A0A4Z2G9Z7_9TELE|nr:hypothetical protein EYF80_039782 [Liparis tanakae]